MIRHAALFRLHHPARSAKEADFLAALATLAAIPGVNDFAIAREISPKNPFAFAVSMRFVDQAAYDAYNNHPLHVAFVRDRWVREVAEFMEHDTVALAGLTGAVRPRRPRSPARCGRACRRAGRRR